MLVVVPCGKRKVWDENPEAGPCEAKDVYRGPLFKVYREYAEKFADKWVILSAKYGFVDPDFTIPENYDVTFKDPKTNPVKVEQLRKQAERMGLNEYDKIVILGGKEYINVVAKVFPASKLITPFKGLPCGKMMQAVKKAISKGELFP